MEPVLFFFPPEFRQAQIETFSYKDKSLDSGFLHRGTNLHYVISIIKMNGGKILNKTTCVNKYLVARASEEAPVWSAF